MKKDYYEVLGVPKTASADEIKKAFRKLAHEHHPDKKGGNAEKFKEANEAYSTLSDDSKRKNYDSFGHAGANMGGGAGGAGFDPGGFGFDFSQFNQGGQGGFQDFDLGDIFGDVFGGGRGGRTRQKKGADISVDVDVDFKDSIFGVDKTIAVSKDSVCDDCAGSGAKKGSKMKTCSTCAGKGKVTEMRRSILGSFSSVKVCDTCHGTGTIPEEKCAGCRGSGIKHKRAEYSVHIPSGIEDEQMIRMTGAGEAISGGTAGDLYVRVHVRSHSFWEIEGHNLVGSLRVKLSDALLGSEYNLETLDGPITLTIPEGVKHNEILRVRGKGVPMDSRHRGDILVTIHIDLPKKLSKEAKKAIEVLRKEGI